MNELNIICIVIAVISVSFALLVAVISRYNMRKTMNRLYKMVDDAISGKFQESTYDESIISALETRMKYYISHNLASEDIINEEKDKIKGLISDISHQTKTPISNILLYASLLKEMGELSEDSMELLNQICTSSEKLNFLIGALIRTSRLETGIISVKAVNNSVAQLIENALIQVEPKAKRKNISINTHWQGENAEFDMKWTAEAVYNIIDNAVKYTEEDGNINIEVRNYELFCRIDIRDDGIGIPEEEQSKIFSRFYRSQMVQNIEGVGIGLFLSREILLAQGAYMKVSSKVGNGSTFSVFLPRK